jgi:hypothetical protein
MIFYLVLSAPLKTPKKTPKKTVKDFDKKLHSAKEKQQAKHNEYFELLKPFLYTGKKNEKKPVIGNFCIFRQ